MEDTEFRKIILKQELKDTEERLENKLKLKKSRQKSFGFLMAFGIVALVVIVGAVMLDDSVNPLRIVSISLLTSTMYCTLYHYAISLPEQQINIDNLKSKIELINRQLKKLKEEESEEV